MKYNHILYALKLWFVTGTVSYWLCIILIKLIYSPVGLGLESLLNTFANSIKYSVGFLLFTIFLVKIIKGLDFSASAKKTILIVVGSPLYLSVDVYLELLGGPRHVPLEYFLLSAMVYTIVFASGVIYYKFPNGYTGREALIRPISAKIEHGL